MRNALLLLTLLLVALTPAQAAAADRAAQGDSLGIETTVTRPRPAHLPTRGMSMAQVESRFGSPQTRRGPVGKPPITRWGYGDFSVVFEYRHVIHVVVPGAPATLHHRDELSSPVTPVAPAPATPPAPESGDSDSVSE